MFYLEHWIICAVMELQNKNDFSEKLEKSLSESKTYAKKGYKLSKDAVKLLRNTINSVSSKLEDNIFSLENSNINDKDLVNSLQGQFFLAEVFLHRFPLLRLAFST